MDPNKAHSWEYQQRAIDTEIKLLEESIHALKHRRNALAPISSLPTEIITAIFFFLRHGTGGQPEIHLALRVTHVCHRWREIALDQPLLWSHIDFTTIGPAGATEILARARMAPLYLEAKVPAPLWNGARFVAFQKELQTHVSHIYHLEIRAELHYLRSTLQTLISPAPILEHLSLSIDSEKHRHGPPWRVYVPDTLFGANTPRLCSLELSRCNISWKSPLLRGLKNLEIITLSGNARPSLMVWLDALDEMSQLTRLVLHRASPYTPRFPVDIERTVTLPFLTHFDISSSQLDCGLALAHLVLPALTSLYVTATSDHPIVGDVQKIIPYVARHAHGPQDNQPLRSVFIHGSTTHLDIFAWPIPNIHVDWSEKMLSARVALTVTSKDWVLPDDQIRIVDATLANLPLDSLVMLTPPEIELDVSFWLRHAPRWPLLERVHLATIPARGFREMLLEDNGGRERPPLPSLKYVDLIGVALSARRTLRLCDALMKRVEQGVPLEVLDLRSCFGTSFAVEMLSEIVVDVLGPTEIIRTEGPVLFEWISGRGPFFPDDDSGADDS